MSTRRTRAVVVALLAIAALLAAGCGGGDKSSGGSTSGSTATPAKQYTVGFSVPILQNPTVQAVVQGMASVAQQRGAKLVVKDANLQGNQQISDLDDLTSQGVDAIVVWATTDPKTLAPALQRASDAGIAIFSIDGTGYAKEITNFEQPSAEMGVIAAGLMAKLAGSGQIGVIGGVPAPSILTRVASFKSTVEEKYPQLDIVAEQDNLKDVAAGAEPLVASMLTKYPSLKGVYTYNDPSAIGASAAARSNGSTELVIIGNNADPQGVAAVQDGRITGTVDAKPVETGENAMNGALDYVSKKDTNPPKVVKVTPVAVTKENVGSFVPWTKRTPAVDYSAVCSGCTG